MEVAIYAKHDDPAIAAVAAGLIAGGSRIYWRSHTHYTAGESEKMDLVLIGVGHPHAEQIKADHEKRGVSVESTAAHIAPKAAKKPEKV